MYYSLEEKVMKMHKESYENLMLRFAKEIHEVGVSENLKKIIESQYNRTPNVSGCSAAEETRKFCYRHNGYEIEASQTVKISVKTCTK